MSTSEDQRLASIDLATQLGRRSDAVVMATLQWDTTGTIKPSDTGAINDAADWLETLAGAVADPLDLVRSLPQLRTLDVLASFGSLAGGLDALLASRSPSSSTDRPSNEAQRSARLTEVASLLRDFSAGNATSGNVAELRELFAQLAQMMLSYSAVMITPRVTEQWTKNSAS